MLCRISVLSASVVVGVVSLLAAPGVSAQQLHKDPVRGFQFKPPKDFKSVALQPNEQRVIAKYQRDTPDSSGDAVSNSPGYGQSYTQMFEVAFFAKGTAIESEEGDKGALASSDSGESHGPLDDVVQWIERIHGDPDIEKDKPVNLAGSEGRELTFASTQLPLKYYCLLLPQEEGIFLFEGSALSQRYDKALVEFSKAAKSFKRIEKSDTAAHDTDLAQMNEQDRFLQQQIDKLPPGWEHLRTKHYLFLYDADKLFVKQLSEQIEAMRREYERMYPPDPANPITAVSIVRVCASFEEFSGYSGAPPGVGGFWNSRAKELVFYDQAPRSETLCVLNHEAFHQYIYYFYGELAPHAWYNEGHGDYFSGARMTSTYRITGYANAPGGYNRRELVKEMVRLEREGKKVDEGAAAPLKKLMHFSQSEYYERAQERPVAFYPEGWAVVHFLREGKGLQPKWQKILPDYLGCLLDARAACADELMKKRLADAEKVKAGSSADLPHDPKEYYEELDEGKVQSRAYDATFKDWTDADWNAFDAAFQDYVEKKL